MQPNKEDVTMHCPGCGVEVALTQKFCRSCGFALEKITQIVAEQLASPELLLETRRLQERQRKIERSLLIAGSGFIATVVVGMVCGIIYLMAVGSMPIVPGVILLIMMTFGMVAGSLATYSDRLKKGLSHPEPSRAPTLAEAQSNLSLPDPRGPLFSVTERTTSLLEPSLEAARNQRKEGDS
jgi:F0F1-type ATP synthase assembly protein I